MKINIKYLILFFVSLNIYINNVSKIDLSPDFIFWSNALYWLNVLPIIIHFNASYKNDIYPYIGTISAFILFSFALPQFFINIENYQLATLKIEALQWAFWGYLTFYTTFYLFKNSYIFKVNPFNPIKTSLNNPKLRSTAFIFLLINIITRNLNITSLGHIGSLGLFIYLGTYIFLINKKVQISKFERFFFYSILLFEYVNRIFDGLLAAVGLLSLFLIVISFISRKKSKMIIIILVIAFLAGFTFLQPIKTKYRQLTWYNQTENNLIQKISIAGELYIEYLSEKAIISEEEEERNSFLWRYSYQASALSLVLNKTPNEVPFWDGSSYLVLSKFIPRFLWPDKPQEIMGYRFGVAYGILSTDDKSTSMNTPLIAEMYMNFGYAGIVIMMFILGLVVLLLNNFFNSNKIDEFGRIYSISIIFPLIAHESNFTLTFGNVPLVIISIYAIIKFYINK